MLVIINSIIIYLFTNIYSFSSFVYSLLFLLNSALPLVTDKYNTKISICNKSYQLQSKC